MVKNLPANAGDAGSIPGSGRSLGEGNGHPLQYSCLEIPMDRGACWVTKVGHDLVTKQQQYVYTHTHTHTYTERETERERERETGKGHTTELKHSQYAWQNIKDHLKGI